MSMPIRGPSTEEVGTANGRWNRGVKGPATRWREKPQHRKRPGLYPSHVALLALATNIAKLGQEVPQEADETLARQLISASEEERSTLQVGPLEG